MIISFAEAGPMALSKRGVPENAVIDPDFTKRWRRGEQKRFTVLADKGYSSVTSIDGAWRSNGICAGTIDRSRCAN
jgi:hypothetical protein